MLLRIVLAALLSIVTRKTYGIYVQISLHFQARRDLDKHSELVANLEDIIEAFDTLDISDSIPSICCEAIDLLNLPPLSLDATAEQVQKNTEVLQNLESQIGSLEKKLTSLGPAGLASSSSCSYATAASASSASPAIRPSSSLTGVILLVLLHTRILEPVTSFFLASLKLVPS